MRKKFRVIDTGHLGAAENMALDESILEAREEDKIPDTIRFLSFNPHAALVGWKCTNNVGDFHRDGKLLMDRDLFVWAWRPNYINVLF